jgi:pimeloyl-ACP methyl ester carboxylesterase
VFGASWSLNQVPETSPFIDHRHAVNPNQPSPALLKHALGVYRANLPPESLIAPPRELPPVTAHAMGVWSSHDLALTEENMTNSAKYVAGPWRYERVEGAGHWLQLDASGEIDALLLDFLNSV